MKYVLGFMFSEEGDKVALIRKNKPDWQKGLLNGIGGKIENGEDTEAAMIREFKEETGYNEPVEWKKIGRMVGKDWFVFCFAAVGDLNLVGTMEEEEVVIIGTAAPDLEVEDRVANLDWLIPFAWNVMFSEGEAFQFSVDYL